MKLDDVIARIVSCGLAEKEARAFAHLTHLGTSKVTDLANAAGLKRAETYQILERLQSRGLVEGSISRPRMFTAVAASRAIGMLVEERANELKAIEAARADLEERLEKLSGGATAQVDQSFRVLHDHNQISGQLVRTVRTATTELAVVASSRGLFRLLLDEGLETEFKAAHERGVRIRILTDVLRGQEGILPHLTDFAEVRHMFVPRPTRFIIADEREIVQYVTADPVTASTKESALWLGARDHVQAQRGFFDDLWAAGMGSHTRLEELETGRAPEMVQVVKGRLTRSEKEKEMILRAKQDIAMVLDASEVSRLEASGVARALRSRMRDGVKVRILVPVGTGLALKQAEVREADVGDILPVILVDHAESLLVFKGKEADEELTDLAAYGIWASLRSSVDVLWKSFENRWSQGK